MEYYPDNIFEQIIPIKFVKSNFKIQIEEDLYIFFNIHIKLDTYDNMKACFINYPDKKYINNYFIIKSKNLEFYSNNNKNTYYYEKTNTNIGTTNDISYYNMNGMKFIFRESNNKKKHTDPNYLVHLFDSFYENLKHLILYIIMCRYMNRIKIIPQPIAMGWYDGYICLLTEAGLYDFHTYLFENHIINIEETCVQIYINLYNINIVPDMNLCFKHCDLKPENIVLTCNNYPLIIDFGLSIFKIDDIDFIRPNNEIEPHPVFITYYEDNNMNTMIDFIILLYFVIYIYKFEIFNNNNNIINYNTLLSLFETINTQYEELKIDNKPIQHNKMYDIITNDNIINCLGDLRFGTESIVDLQLVKKVSPY